MLDENILKERVKGNVFFQFAQSGELWYRTESGFFFSVPFADVGSARFDLVMKGIMLMRWIRRAMQKGEQ